MMKWHLAGVAGLALFTPARAEEWEATPLIVHEWGVHEFDWSRAAAPAPVDIPGYLYTDKRPGRPTTMPAKRVKDYPPDTGIRDKPVVYFYPAESPRGINVGVEVRFAQGHASAWYPQASLYRTPDIAANGADGDLAAWHKQNPARAFTKKPWTAPDDTRMELSWYSLTLSNGLPSGLQLPGGDLPADHWSKIARDVPGAAYVSNGTEAERYLFYEGATREQPALAVIPVTRMGAARNTFNVVNVSGTEVHDVFAIYHAGGHTWANYISTLEPMKGGSPGISAGNTIASLPLPDFSGKVDWLDDAALRHATNDRLLSALTQGGTVVAQTQMRDPADPQGPTSSAMLYPDEAAALEKIWNRDFFEAGTQDGLTLLYRESPASLDAAMPLHIYTDMYHYVELSRCGMVLNSHIDLATAERVFRAAYVASMADDLSARQTAMVLMRQFPLLAQGALRYVALSGTASRFSALSQALTSP